MTKAEQVLEYLTEYMADKYKHEDNLEILESNFGQTVIENKYLDKRRWYTVVRAIWRFEDDSHLAVQWHEGNTEYQEWEGPTAWYLVEPKEKIVLTYEKVDK